MDAKLTKVVLAFDSFKGSASSMEIAEAAKESILRLLPDCRVEIFAIADGGEGTTDAICRQLSATKVECLVHDPLMRPLEVAYRMTADHSMAIMEMAAASGLPLVETSLRNPRQTTTFGTGEMVLDAISLGCRKIVMGIGGSATNDAAVGMLTALGFRFLDASGNETADLQKINRVDESQVSQAVKETEFTVVCDVQNPFYGQNGAAYVYAPQKGATKEDVEYLDKGLRNFAEVVLKTTGIDLQSVPGSGAAGGMGGGLLAFLNAKLQPGIETILKMANFEEALADASLVITGEGRIDSQTTMGKALSGILTMSQAQNVPIVAIGGSVESYEKVVESGFHAVLSIQNGPVSLEMAMNKEFTLENVKQTVAQIVRLIELSKK